MHLDYIKTMDFTFEDIEVTNCDNIEQLYKKIRDNDVVQIDNDGYIEHINPAYIMFFGNWNK